MTSDTVPMEPALQAVASSPAPVVTEGGLPTWFDDTSPGGRRRNRLARLARPAAFLLATTLAAGLWAAGWHAAAITVAGVAALALGFLAGMFFLRRILSGSHPVVAVARAIVEEAIGTKLSIVLVLLVVVSLPVLPLLLDPSERLAYRTQFFLTWALSVASVLLSMITIALGCSSVSGDIDSKRIHMALSKPLRRWEYLLGKWLGVVLLDLVLVGLVGIGTYSFARALGRLPAADGADRIAVDEQVLTARASARPEHPSGSEFERSVAATIEEIRREDPTTFDKNPARARKRILAQRVHEWHTVTADVVSSFMFTGLDTRKIRAPVVQLRLEPFADNSMIARADVRFALWLNERPFPVRNGKHEEYTFSTGMVHTIDLPTAYIADDGTLRLTLANRNLIMPGEERPTSISFTPGEGLEILYRVGGFGSNFAKGLLLLWAKLAMLAAAALAAAAWLGFPTALLTGLMVYVTAASSAFFADAIDIYTGLDRRGDTFVAMLRLRLSMLLERILKWEWWEAIKTIGSYAADGFLAIVPSFGAYDSIKQVATGRVVPLTEMAMGLVVLGAAYPLVLLAIGWMLLERRDLVGSSS
jgi:ABC-type transport system involved in multi-copper enzyme maturation permease subunit